MNLFQRLIEEPLTEAQDYKSMFNEFFRWNSKEMVARRIPAITSNKGYEDGFLDNVLEVSNKKATELIEIEIAWARHYLKKNDRIVWYLRWIKAILFYDYGSSAGSNVGNPVLHQPFFKKWYDNSIAMYDGDPALEVWAEALLKGATKRQLPNFQRAMEHTLSLPVSAIQDYVWNYQSPGRMRTDLNELEAEWQEALNARIAHDPATFKEVVLDFHNGWMWVDLGRGACEEEGRAMGHCGNVPSVQKGDTILSLRQLKNEGGHKFWEPHCTFILHQNGILGEMKGRANEKPAKKYHSYITALLKTPVIKGVAGGGYDPVNNFSMNDLEPEERESLLAFKSTLLDINAAGGYLFSDKEGIRNSAREVFIEKLEEAIQQQYSGPHAGHDIQVDDKHVICTFFNQRDFVEAVTGLQGEKALEMYNDGTEEMYDVPHITYDIINEFIPYSNELYNTIIEYCKTEYNNKADVDYQAYCDERELEVDDIDNVLAFLVDEDDRKLAQLYYDSIEHGHYKGVSNRAKSILDDIGRIVHLTNVRHHSDPDPLMPVVIGYTDGKTVTPWKEFNENLKPCVMLDFANPAVQRALWPSESPQENYEAFLEILEDNSLGIEADDLDVDINWNDLFDDREATKYFKENAPEVFKIKARKSKR